MLLPPVEHNRSRRRRRPGSPTRPTWPRSGWRSARTSRAITGLPPRPSRGASVWFPTIHWPPSTRRTGAGGRGGGREAGAGEPEVVHRAALPRGLVHGRVRLRGPRAGPGPGAGAPGGHGRPHRRTGAPAAQSPLTVPVHARGLRIPLRADRPRGDRLSEVASAGGIAGRRNGRCSSCCATRGTQGTPGRRRCRPGAPCVRYVRAACLSRRSPPTGCRRPVRRPARRSRARRGTAPSKRASGTR